LAQALPASEIQTLEQVETQLEPQHGRIGSHRAALLLVKQYLRQSNKQLMGLIHDVLAWAASQKQLSEEQLVNRR
jgi:hypothetical protein